METGLRKALNLFDATAIGIGAIVGAGIFVALGITVGYAGPAAIISIIMAGVVASFTAFSSAEVGSAIPKEGAYTNTRTSWSLRSWPSSSVASGSLYKSYRRQH
jgi:amino acid transporter